MGVHIPRGHFTFLKKLSTYQKYLFYGDKHENTEKHSEDKKVYNGAMIRVSNSEDKKVYNGAMIRVSKIYISDQSPSNL